MSTDNMIEGLLELRGADETPFSDSIPLTAYRLAQDLLSVDNLENSLLDAAKAGNYSNSEVGFVIGVVNLSRSGPFLEYNTDTVFINWLISIEHHIIFPWVIAEIFSVYSVLEGHLTDFLMRYIDRISYKLHDLSRDELEVFLTVARRTFNYTGDDTYGRIIKQFER